MVDAEAGSGDDLGHLGLGLHLELLARLVGFGGFDLRADALDQAIDLAGGFDKRGHALISQFELFRSFGIAGLSVGHVCLLAE